MFDRDQLQTLIQTHGSDRLCMGSDYPFDMAEPDPVRFHNALDPNVSEKILPVVRGQLRVAEGRDPQPSAGLIDSQSVRGADTVNLSGGTRTLTATARLGDPATWAVTATDRAGNSASDSVTRTPVLLTEAAATRTGTCCSAISTAAGRNSARVSMSASRSSPGTSRRVSRRA